MDLSRLFLIAALFAVFVAMLVAGARDADREVLMLLYAADRPWLEPTARAVTFLGEWWTMVGITLAGAGWLAWRGLRREALLLLIASFTGRGLVIGAKAYFARLRPEEHLRLVEVSSMSFPSSHASNSMIVLLGLGMLGFQGRSRHLAVSTALAIAFAIGLSRPLLGVHWPSDVIGGWSFGAAWLLLVVLIADRLAPAAVKR